MQLKTLTSCSPMLLQVLKCLSRPSEGHCTAHAVLHQCLPVSNHFWALLYHQIEAINQPSDKLSVVTFCCYKRHCQVSLATCKVSACWHAELLCHLIVSKSSEICPQQRRDDTCLACTSNECSVMCGISTQI